MSRAAVLLLALVCSAAVLAQPSPFANRAQALAALDAPDVAHRANAVIWIVNFGAPADEEVVRRRLVDESPEVRELAEQGLWLMWSRSGDAKINTLMAAGAAQIQAGQLDDAIATFSEVIRRKPAFAEGWNRRATVLFMTGEYKRSLADCDQVMKRNPHHFGALAGYGQIYFQLKQYDKAIEYWRRALKENPNMAGVEDSIELAAKLLAERRKNSA